jgi:BirA family biotin operon repressor/biotin-[acetyl-CoA-carboxylase] ligase
MHERDLLARLIAGPASGDALARASGQTRAAVWKRIAALREAGVPIDARAGRGYALAVPLELLDADAIRAGLAPALRDELQALDVAWSLESTSTALLQRATPARGVAVQLAERQTGGRGRRGRQWASPLAANIYLSLARAFGGGLARLPGLSLVVGVASAEALHALGFRDVRLKWPNDLVVERDGTLHKLGGLLVEGGGEHAGPVRAVIGLGLNVRMPVQSAGTIQQSWTDLATLAGGAAPSRNAVVSALLGHWLPALAQFDAHGLEGFLPRHAALDALAGRTVRIEGEQDAHEGVALGLAPDGALRVRFAEGERVVHAGEVSVRPARVQA